MRRGRAVLTHVWETKVGTRTRKFENLGSEVFEDGRTVYCGLSTDANIMLCTLLEVTVNTADRELWAPSHFPSRTEYRRRNEYRGASHRVIGCNPLVSATVTDSRKRWKHAPAALPSDSASAASAVSPLPAPFLWLESPAAQLHRWSCARCLLSGSFQLPQSSNFC